MLLFQDHTSLDFLNMSSAQRRGTCCRQTSLYQTTSWTLYRLFHAPSPPDRHPYITVSLFTVVNRTLRRDGAVVMSCGTSRPRPDLYRTQTDRGHSQPQSSSVGPMKTQTLQITGRSGFVQLQNYEYET